VKEIFLDQPLTLTSLIMGNTGKKEARQTASQFVHKLHPILAKNTEDEDFEEDGIVRQRIVVKYFPHTPP